MHLFKPDDAIRTFRPAAIDYFLQKPANKVTVEILDASGKVVRTFTASAEDEKKAKKPEDEEAEFGPPRTPPPGRKAGTNRFTWDLRYPGATVFEGLVMWGARADMGPLAVPGSYQVRVTADGVSQTQPLTLKQDPREKVTMAELQQQFDLAVKVRDEVSLCDDMVIAIRKINKEAKERADKSKDEAVMEASASLRDELSTIEESVYQIRNRANEDPLNFPIKINNQIAALARIVETGDNEPTDQDYEIFKLLTQRLAVIQTKYDHAVKVDVPKFNDVLVKHKLAVISDGGSN
jgi:hypothetical protein